MIKSNRFLVLGRAGMDLYAEPINTRIEHAHQYKACLGGSAGNIAASLARLGQSVSLICCVSDDAIGRFTLSELEHYGISTQWVRTVQGESRTNLAVVETRTEDTQAVIYRNGAVDFELREQDVEHLNYSKFGALIIAGTALAQQPSANAVLAAIDLAGKFGLTTILDIDYRPYSWESDKQASQAYLNAAHQVDIVIGNDVEFEVMAGVGNSGIKLAEELGKNHLVVYKMGEKGSITYHQDNHFQTAIYPVNALKPTGAGDAFMGGFCSALADGHELQSAVARGSACAAIVVSRVGCSPAMPDKIELETFLAEHKT